MLTSRVFLFIFPIHEIEKLKHSLDTAFLGCVLLRNPGERGKPFTYSYCTLYVLVHFCGKHEGNFLWVCLSLNRVP